MILEIEEIIGFFSSFSHTNKLVRFYDKVDGLKTGFTTNAGYCLTATAKKNNMRLIAVVMGEPTSKIRNKEVSEMLDYGFSWYKTTSIFNKGNKLKKIKIDKGKIKNANICLTEDIILLNKKNDIEYRIEITNNSAPILKGIKLVIYIYIIMIKRLKKILTIDKSIKKANFFNLYIRSLGDLITEDINF